MKVISHESTFMSVLGLERAIIVCHAEWSGPSAKILQLLQNEEGKISPSDIPIFVTEPDRQPFVDDWLKTQNLPNLKYRGNGEILLISRGQLVQSIMYDATVTHINELISKTWK